MQQKVVFITGGSSGIGAYLAREFLSHGHRVYVCGRSQERFDHQFSADVKAPEFLLLDTADREKTKQAVKSIVDREGRLDIMVANAGVAFGNKSRIPDFERSIDMVHINFLGVMYSFEAALGVMNRQGHGHLVGMASVAGFNGLPGVAAYSASKAAVIKMCETFSLDLPEVGIDCSCLCPGFIDTPLTRQNRHPMPFLMEPQTAAAKMYRAILKKKPFYSLPWQMYLIVRLLEIMPRWLYRNLMKSRLFNYSQKSVKN